MNVSLRQLRAFTAVAEHGSFAAACERLYISQPALSVCIRNMEQAVGGALFQRNTRNVELTPEGRNFLPTALRLQSDWDRAFDDLQRAFTLQQGKLTVAVMPSFAISQFPELAARFRASFPDINLKVEDIVMEDVVDAVLSGRAELGISLKPDKLDGVDFIPLFTDRFTAVVPKAHALARRKSVRWRDLAEQTFIGMNLGSWVRHATDEAMKLAEIQPLALLEANQLATISGMVAAGVGVSVIPALSANYAKHSEIVAIPIKNPILEREVGLFIPKRRALSVAAQEFMSCVCDFHELKHAPAIC